MLKEGLREEGELLQSHAECVTLYSRINQTGISDNKLCTDPRRIGE
jgi:hypothetical protein